MPFSSSLDPVLSFDVVLPALSVSGERQFATAIARAVASEIGINERILAERLADAERQQSSAIGCGASIAHLPLSGLNMPFSIFVRLKQPLDRKAPDAIPVDLACVLLTPEREGNAYLPVLARLSRLLRQKDVAARLRAAENDFAIRAALGHVATPKAA